MGHSSLLTPGALFFSGRDHRQTLRNHTQERRKPLWSAGRAAGTIEHGSRLHRCWREEPPRAIRPAGESVMPLHDWTRVEAGIFHDFHNAWVVELRTALNGGLLPPDYYA